MLVTLLFTLVFTRFSHWFSQWDSHSQPLVFALLDTPLACHHEIHFSRAQFNWKFTLSFTGIAPARALSHISVLLHDDSEA